MEERALNPSRAFRSESRGGRARGRAQHRRDGQGSHVQLSKALSYVLRHGARKMGLHIQEDGFVDVQDILNHPQFRRYTETDVAHVVQMNDKQRFEMCSSPSTGCLQIRANQGHSLELEELELTPITLASELPKVVLHGTYLRSWPSIRENGLSRMGRMHIHFAPGEPDKSHVISGMRRNCEVAIYIDVVTALQDCLEFFWSKNKVILCPGDEHGFLLPKYFSKVVRLGQQPVDLL
uniref:2'-phosphotransferase n=1 Tax=Eptatretus burgeri TaxID=7764 RepID=A0A8C4QVR7_EPTBU